MNTVKVNAYAKLNLTLDITGRAGEHHTLDSLVTTVDLYDRITIKRRKDKLVRITMRGMGRDLIPPEQNHALAAAEAFVREFATCGADITVDKNIPLASGMGGSSADSAAVIAGMGRLFSVSDHAALKALCDRFGSDTGYLLTGGLCRIRGRGEVVERLPFVPMHFLALCPREGVSTAACYRKFDELGARCSARTEEAVRLMGEPALCAPLFGNDLYPPAVALAPVIEKTLAEARSFSPLGASMTGSGSTVFAVFETRELAAWAQSRYHGNARSYILSSVDPKHRKMPAGPYRLSGDADEE